MRGSNTPDGARVIGKPWVGHADLEIGSMAIRGCGLSPAAGQSLAAAVADTLARQLVGRSRHIGAMTVRMPASILDASGGIDHAALGRAILRAERDPDA